MKKRQKRPGGASRFLCVLSVVAGGLLIAACSDRANGPAPVYMRGGGPGVAGEYRGTGLPSAEAPRRADKRIVVRPGQSVGRIAQTYHVPKRAIIEANKLKPPYVIKTGSKLIIPGIGEPVREPASGGAAPIVAAAPSRQPEVIPLDDPAPRRPTSAAGGAAPVATLTPPGPLRSAAAAAGSPVAGPPPAGLTAEPSAADEARADAGRSAAAGPEQAKPLPRGGHFAWPVRGRVLAGYGAAAGGGHNDGINIAAPKGAPIAAIDAGVVAYAGNELRGYGNLVLIKHADGWISAYAHCDELLVKRGDKVSRGQVIAKVGATGSVREPQLHFELRRGKQPVDPKSYLGTPSAAAADPASVG